MRNDEYNNSGSRLHRSRYNQILPGIFLVIIGALFLSRKAGVDYPGWIFTWPMLLIGISLFVGSAQRFKPGGWMVMALFGAIFLIEKIDGSFFLRPYLWPLAIIAVGLFIIFKPKRKSSFRPIEASSTSQSSSSSFTDQASAEQSNSFSDYSEMLDISALFGGVKKRVLSKNLKGGEVLAVMGGAEINLEQADFNGRIKIELFTMFGGTKLIIPADWDVQSEIVAIFGGVDDKRPPATGGNRSKVLFLEGTCIFGGIDIRSF